MPHLPDPHELAPLSQQDLNKIMDMHSMFLSGTVGGGRAVIQYSDLSGLNFKGYDLSQADFTGSLMVDANLSGGIFVSASFFACDLRNADLRGSNLSRADFRGAYVAGANLSGANMSGIDLREGKIMKRGAYGVLEDRKRSGGKGAHVIFSGAKLTETNMSGARAAAADFSDADLTGVNLTDSNLNGACFENANLTDTDLTGADLTRVNMRSSILTGALLEDTERKGLDLTAAVTEHDMGTKLVNLGKSLHELLEEHTLWVATAGRSGRQLNLSGYDLRDVVDLRRFPLTAIECMGANFLSQDLCAAELQSGVFDRSDFRDCRMIDSDLRGSSFKYAKLARADLSGARLCPLEFNRDGRRFLQRVDMSGANLRFASLQQADLRECIMMGVDLSNADLRGSDLRRADLTGAILRGAKLSDVRMEGAIIDTRGA